MVDGWTGYSVAAYRHQSRLDVGLLNVPPNIGTGPHDGADDNDDTDQLLVVAVVDVSSHDRHSSCFGSDGLDMVKSSSYLRDDVLD